MIHNDHRESFASWIIDVCHDFEIQPPLQPLHRKTFALKPIITDNDPRLDIRVNELWESIFNKTYFGVQLLNPQAKRCRENSSKAWPTSSLNLLKKTQMNKE